MKEGSDGMEHRLPVNFEEFSEARRNGFLAAKEIKDQGGLIAGTFCTYTPLEIFDAAGMYTVSLCGTSNETVADAERDLPKNLCPLIKSSYGFAVSDKCPYTYFSDIIVGETTCDGKKKMYELLGKMKNVYILHLPQGTDRPDALDQWTEELRRLIRTLTEQFGVEITEEKLRAAARWRNGLRAADQRIMHLQEHVPPVMEMSDLFHVTGSIDFSFDHDETLRRIEEVTDEVERAYLSGTRPVSADRARILTTGCPTGGVLHKTIGAIERNGGVVVCMENCNGLKSAENFVDAEAPDIVRAIAERYLKIPCSVMSPNPGRLDSIRRMVRDFHVDGIVDIILTACHTYNVETAQIRAVARELGVPYLAVETDYSETDEGGLETRLGAFVEMLKG